MSPRLSRRARRFMATWERRPHVKNLDLVRAALEEAKVPVTEPDLDFHRTFAGYVTDVWGDKGVLGIIHREVRSQSWFQPMKVGGYLDAKRKHWMLACADVHVSWEMMIELDGTFHANGPEASSYFLWTEQAAFLWEFSSDRRLKAVPLWLHTSPEELTAILLPRLAEFRIDPLCDQHSQVFATKQMVVIVRRGDYVNAWVAEGENPPELAEIPRRRR